MSSFGLDDFLRELDEEPLFEEDQLTLPFDDSPVPADVLKDMDFKNEDEMEEEDLLAALTPKPKKTRRKRKKKTI